MKKMHVRKKVTREYGLLETFLANKRAEIANNLIPIEYRRGRILDIGCGNYPYFLDNTIFAEKFGMDQVSHDSLISKWLVRKKINFKKFDIEKDGTPPFEDDYFDVVTMLAVAEHIKPEILVSVVPEMHRILKKGGVLVMTTPTPWADIVLKIMDKMKLISRTDFAEHKKAYSIKEMFSILNKGGFQKEKIKLGYFEMFFNIWGIAEK